MLQLFKLKYLAKETKIVAKRLFGSEMMESQESLEGVAFGAKALMALGWGLQGTCGEY